LIWIKLAEYFCLPNPAMQSPSAQVPAGLTLLIELAQGKISSDVAAAARALGFFPAAFERLAQRAYPLSPADAASHLLLRDIGRVLAARTGAAGLEAALAELAAASSDPKPEAFFGFLSGA
jgi:hypothetical protein